MFNVVLSESTIFRYLESFSYSIKRVHIMPLRRNDEQAIKDRFNYGNYFMSLLSASFSQTIIFIDEIGFNVSMRTRKDRSLIGIRATQTV